MKNFQDFSEVQLLTCTAFQVCGTPRAIVSPFPVSSQAAQEEGARILTTSWTTDVLLGGVLPRAHRGNGGGVYHAWCRDSRSELSGVLGLTVLALLYRNEPKQSRSWVLNR